MSDSVNGLIEELNIRDPEFPQRLSEAIYNVWVASVRTYVAGTTETISAHAEKADNKKADMPKFESHQDLAYFISVLMNDSLSSYITTMAPVVMSGDSVLDGEHKHSVQ